MSISRRSAIPPHSGCATLNAGAVCQETHCRPAFRRLGASVFAAHLFLAVLALTIAPLSGRGDW